MKKKADDVLRSFARFLATGWQDVEALIGPIDQFNELAADWLQSSWEVLVESVLLPGSSGFLEVYGDGAEGSSCRIFLPEAQATHRIMCLPKGGEPAMEDLNSGRIVDPREMIFWGFVHWDGEVYALAPPFNAVLLEPASAGAVKNVVVPIENVEFGLEEISDNHGRSVDRRSD